MKAMSTSTTLGNFAKSLGCKELAVATSPKGKSKLAVGILEDGTKLFLAFLTKKAPQNPNPDEMKQWDIWEFTSNDESKRTLNGCAPSTASYNIIARVTL